MSPHVICHEGAAHHRVYKARVRSFLAAILLLPLACDRPSPPTEPPLPPKVSSDLVQARLERDLEQLALEAGVEPSPPSAPLGSLREEVEGFTSLDACAKRVASVDPLLGDALDALGYDELARDACRVLEALAKRDVNKCAPILASPLRARCETDVATLVGKPDLCPQSSLGRDPICLARARRDPRLCEAIALADKPTCKAMVTGDASACGGDVRCERQVQRWSSLFEPPQATEPFATHLVVEIEKEPGDVRLFELKELSAQGAVVRRAKGRYEVSLGAKLSDTVVRAANVETVAGHFQFKLPIHSEAPTEVPLDPANAHFELLLPGCGLLTSAGGQAKGAFHVTSFTPEVGADLAFDLEANAVGAAQVVPLRARVNTFVRDVVKP